MPSQTKRICFIGDSHLGSPKLALDEGLVDLGCEVEFWGATGPEFRQIRHVDGMLKCTTTASAEKVARVNSQGRTAIGPADFDGFVFYGARLRLSELLPPILARLCDAGQSLSTAVMRLMIRRYFGSRRAYRAAADFAATRPVWFVPASLLNVPEGDLFAPGRAYAGYGAAQTAAPATRADVMQALVDVAAEDAVRLLPQDEATISDGIFTHRDYAAVPDGDTDLVHKSPAFAARHLQELRDQLRDRL